MSKDMVIRDRAQGVDCPECEESVPHTHRGPTAELIAEARRALDESRISPMRSFDDDKDFALAEWSRNNLARLVDALAESERRREAAESAMHWEDVDDEWTPAIKAAHPTRSDSHEEYAKAMKMVGHRHSKGELVALVNWLLVRLRGEEWGVWNLNGKGGWCYASPVNSRPFRGSRADAQVLCEKLTTEGRSRYEVRPLLDAALRGAER